VKTLEEQLAEYCQHQEENHGPITPEELSKTAQGSDDGFTVFDLRQDREAQRLDHHEGPPLRKRWAVLAAVAAATVLVVGVVTVADRTGQDLVTDAASSTGVVDSVASSGWSRVPYDEAVFGGSGEQVMRGVTAGGPGLVAVGTDGSSPYPVAAVWTSVDGITWARVPHDEAAFGGPLGQGMWSVTAGGPGLVAVGTVSDAWAVVWTSVDGISWSRVLLDDAVFGDETGHVMSSVTAGGPGLVAVGGAGRDDQHAAVWTSVDGITWSRVAHDEAVFGGGWMNSVTAGGPGLVAVGGADEHAAVWTSVDGITWSRVAHDEVVFGGEEVPWMSSVSVGGPGLVAVGSKGTGGHVGPRLTLDAVVWTSVDGITWSRIPHDEAVFGGETFRSMNSVTATSSGLVAVGEDGVGNEPGAAIWTSVDGITWTRVPHDEALFGDTEMIGVTAGGPGLVAVGGSEEGAVVWATVTEN
jgi:hypothetical protein